MCIRDSSKGVGIYFCTQDPSDVPDSVLGQLGMKVQHALRAVSYTHLRAHETVLDIVCRLLLEKTTTTKSKTILHIDTINNKLTTSVLHTL